MNTLVYDPNVPEKPGEFLADTQPDFLTNFEALYHVFLTNHTALDAANGGMHTIAELLEQEGMPQTNVNEVSVYSKDVDGQTDQVFIAYPNGTEIQLTNYQLYTLPPTSSQTSYFTVLPGKLIVYFGTYTTSTSFGEPVNPLNLLPAVSKHIMTLSFCPKSATNVLSRIKPSVTLQTAENGFIKAINVNAPITVTSSYFYIVVGNM